ncbi:cation diffusion facilitator family transporter [candidate division KSB1 bacterium]|nr:cation diffusion facilitator family transporter [candidate division KSB1 bacterium]
MNSDIKRIRTDAPDPARQALYRRAIYIAIGGNAILAIAKGLLAWLSGSSAVFSDAANSFSDMLYSLLMGLGLYLSQQPPDESHPQGHSRFEPLVSLFIALAMLSAGATALWQSIQRFLSDARPIDPFWPTIVLLLSALAKVVMYVLVKKIGEKSNSPAIRASARDNLADILTSLAALVGVLGSRFLWPALDPVAGVLVALWIFRATWEIMGENLGYLTGRGAPKELTQQIASIASDVPGVINAHRVVADYVGPQLRVDMHIDVNPQITLEYAHEIAEDVRERIEQMIEVDLVFVHVEPAHKNVK